MAEKQLSQIITEYTKELEKKITVSKIILYGSFAYGNPRLGSDIDLIVISPDFEKMRPLERLEFLSLATRVNKNPIEAIGYTPEEFKNAENHIFLDHIVKNGKTVYD